MGNALRGAVGLSMLILTWEGSAASWWEGPKTGDTIVELPMDAAQAATHWTDSEKWEAIDSEELGRKVMHPTASGTLATWYCVLEPEHPVAIPGRAKALGVWVNAA